jgi:hypothetical protein
MPSQKKTPSSDLSGSSGFVEGLLEQAKVKRANPRRVITPIQRARPGVPM